MSMQRFLQIEDRLNRVELDVAERVDGGELIQQVRALREDVDTLSKIVLQIQEERRTSKLREQLQKEGKKV